MSSSHCDATCSTSEPAMRSDGAASPRLARSRPPTAPNCLWTTARRPSAPSGMKGTMVPNRPRFSHRPSQISRSTSRLIAAIITPSARVPTPAATAASVAKRAPGPDRPSAAAAAASRAALMASRPQLVVMMITALVASTVSPLPDAMVPESRKFIRKDDARGVVAPLAAHPARPPVLRLPDEVGQLAPLLITNVVRVAAEFGQVPTAEVLVRDARAQERFAARHAKLRFANPGRPSEEHAERTLGVRQAEPAPPQRTHDNVFRGGLPVDPCVQRGGKRTKMAAADECGRCGRELGLNLGTLTIPLALFTLRPHGCLHPGGGGRSFLRYRLRHRCA
eukprot:scaffold567_cov127-Isochrysis_galbana.AAC.10